MRLSQQKSSAFIVCLNVLEDFMANSVDPDQTAPIGAVCSRSTLFAFKLNSSVMLGNYLQQTTFSDAFFFLGALVVKVVAFLKQQFWSHLIVT